VSTFESLLEIVGAIASIFLLALGAYYGLWRGEYAHACFCLILAYGGKRS
jgi:hypothetical protein